MFAQKLSEICLLFLQNAELIRGFGVITKEKEKYYIIWFYQQSPKDERPLLYLLKIKVVLHLIQYLHSLSLSSSSPSSSVFEDSKQVREELEAVGREGMFSKAIVSNSRASAMQLSMFQMPSFASSKVFLLM